MEKAVSPNVLYMTYEDLILNYEDSRNKVFDFLDIDPRMHTHQFEYFDPAVSIKRIGAWKNFSNVNWFTDEAWNDFCMALAEEFTLGD